MSSALVKAHGGSRDIVSTQKGESIVLGGIIGDTKRNSPKDIKEKHLDSLISRTTGVSSEKPIMDGVLQTTVPKSMKDVPELKKVDKKEVGKTQPKRKGQIPYNGPKY